MTPPSPLPGTLIIAGCSRRKTTTIPPAPALELYAGGIAPQLRARFGGRPELLQRIFFLSARHGLVGADTRLHPYDQPLTPERAADLRPSVYRMLRWHLDELGVAARLLVVAEPLYLVLLTDLLADEDRPIVRWIPDPRGWNAAAAVLDEWNWP
jgi:hypothetical protein